MKERSDKAYALSNLSLWTWGESNPCPKAHSLRHLPLQSVILLSPFPQFIASRHALNLSSFMIRLHPQSLGCIVSYIVDARVLTCRCVRSDSCHIRQRVLNYFQRLFFFEVFRWSPTTNGFRNFKIPVETSTSPGLKTMQHRFDKSYWRNSFISLSTLWHNYIIFSSSNQG